jgi:hypothetical protein
MQGFRVKEQNVRLRLTIATILQQTGDPATLAWALRDWTGKAAKDEENVANERVRFPWIRERHAKLLRAELHLTSRV